MARQEKVNPVKKKNWAVKNQIVYLTNLGYERSRAKSIYSRQ